jgi:hypothetical protein
MYDCFVTGTSMPMMSLSWKASVPITAVATCPVMATIGIESMWASAIPVIRFVAPGPEVAMHTPALPVARAMPCAANAAACSCRTITCFSRGNFGNASYTGMIAPPVYPNRYVTPSFTRDRHISSAPVIVFFLIVIGNPPGPRS